MKSERVVEIYDRLSKMDVQLDRDPVSRGPQYMQDLISLTRGYLNEVGVYIQEAYRERHRLETAKEALETAFQIQSDELLTSDVRVMGLPAVEDRRAMINVILSEQRREIATLSRQIKDLDHVEKALRFRHKELDNTMSAIRLQKALVAMELGTGSLYGDESDTSRGSSWSKKKLPPLSDDLDESDLVASVEKAIQDLEAEAEPFPEKATGNSKEASESVFENSVTVEETDTFGFDDLLLGLQSPVPKEEPKSSDTPQDVGQASKVEPNPDSDIEAFLGGSDEKDEFEDILRFV